MIKAVFFDVDGTLVSFQTHRVPDSAVEAIRKLREKGIKVFIATGRRLRAINNLGGMEFDGYVTLNGSYCYAGGNKVIYTHTIPPEDIRKLAGYLQQQPFPCIFVREQDTFINYMDERVRELFRMLNLGEEPPIKDLQEAFVLPVFQLLAFYDPEKENEVMQKLPHCQSTRWTPLFADVIPLGSGKEVGVQKILEYYGIAKEEAMAFGDGGNDRTMLEYVGIGVAMGNGGVSVKAAADFVTHTVDENGVEYALKHFGLLT